MELNVVTQSENAPSIHNYCGSFCLASFICEQITSGRATNELYEKINEQVSKTYRISSADTAQILKSLDGDAQLYFMLYPVLDIIKTATNEDHIHMEGIDYVEFEQVAEYLGYAHIHILGGSNEIIHEAFNASTSLIDKIDDLKATLTNNIHKSIDKTTYDELKSKFQDCCVTFEPQRPVAEKSRIFKMTHFHRLFSGRQRSIRVPDFFTQSESGYFARKSTILAVRKHLTLLGLIGDHNDTNEELLAADDILLVASLYGELNGRIMDQHAKIVNIIRDNADDKLMRGFKIRRAKEDLRGYLKENYRLHFAQIWILLAMIYDNICRIIGVESNDTLPEYSVFAEPLAPPAPKRHKSTDEHSIFNHNTSSVTSGPDAFNGDIAHTQLTGNRILFPDMDAPDDTNSLPTHCPTYAY